METVVSPQSQDEEELRLLLDWGRPADRSRWQKAGSLSVALHILAILVLFLLPRDIVTPPPRETVRRVTPLIAPPEEVTQRAPNRGKISKDFNIEALLPRPRIQSPRSSPPVPPPAARALSIPAAKPATPLPEPPKIEATTRDNPPKPAPETAPPPPPAPQIQAQEKPKLAFEAPRPAPSPPSTGQGITRPIAPPSAVDEAVRNLAHGGASSGGIVVSDLSSGPGGSGEGITQQPLPGKQGSALELLSDPMGVDFKPYLLQILSTVRRNWFAVMPESAKLGRRGKVAMQFAISRDGTVVKVVFAVNSGVESLDRAAVASISMSNPFPPLPGEFKGNQIRLQFTFQYNVPVN